MLSGWVSLYKFSILPSDKVAYAPACIESDLYASQEPTQGIEMVEK